MSKRHALRTLKRERRADVWAYLAAISPDPVRASHKVRTRIRATKKELTRP
jgi:hypothetical protein